ncbi:MAG: ketopantoate reductase C-terminal domain-containing protein, partial [Rhizomicrobium sp.]
VKTYPVRTVLNPGEQGKPDWVLLCVKAHQVASAAPWLHGAEKLAVLQNGVEHREAVRPYVADNAAVVPVVVNLPVDRTAPGTVIWHSRAILTAPEDPPSAEFAALFGGTFINAQVSADWITAAWTKMCVNAPGAILALTGQTMGVFRKRGITGLARAILSECVAVAQAEGAKIATDLIDRQLAAFLAEADREPGNGNSIYADRMAGRAMEWNARNGVIVRKAVKYGIATPVSSTVVPLLASLDP